MVTNNSANYAPTQYAVQIGAANGGIASVSLGSSGQILTSAGAAADPSFQNAASGSSKWVFISKQPATSSPSIVFSSGISSTYNNYIFVLTNIIASADILMEFSNDGGMGYDEGNNIGGAAYFSGSDTFFSYNTMTEGIVLDSSSPSIAPGLNAVVWFMNRNNIYSVCGEAISTQSGPSSVKRVKIYGQNSSMLTGVDAIRFTTPSQSANITSGTITMYGLMES